MSYDLIVYDRSFFDCVLFLYFLRFASLFLLQRTYVNLFDRRRIYFRFNDTCCYGERIDRFLKTFCVKLIQQKSYILFISSGSTLL